MLDQMLIRYCSPTLGALKTANLFSFSFLSKEELDYMLTMWNEELNLKGVSLHLLGIRKKRALIYVCRTSMLEKDLLKDGVRGFLKGYGYRDTFVSGYIDKLKERIRCSNEFPHEIGLFLGYPLADVKGFIENNGKNYKCTGEWKVYCNECEAMNQFTKFKKCREVYIKLFENRIKSVFQLTVAVS